MKIMFMSDNISFQPTGFARESRQICRCLRDAGHDIVHIGCHSPNHNILDYEGMKVYSVEGMGEELLMKQILSLEKPDLFITFWDMRKLMHIVNIDRFIKCPWLNYYLLDNGPLPWEYYCIYSLEQMNVIPISQFLKDAFDEVGIKTLDNIPLGTDIDEFYPLPIDEKTELRKNALGDNADKVVFGFIGKNMPRKNIPLLMEAFSKLPQKIKDDSILLLHTQAAMYENNNMNEMQTGHDLVNLRKFLYKEKNILFSKTIGDFNYDMNKIYNLFDFGVSATFQEGWGKCTSEGMSSGIPMIITDVSTSKEICGDDYPFIVKSGASNLFLGVSINANYPNVDDFTKKMEEAYYLKRADPKEYEELCIKSRERIVNGLSRKCTNAKWIQLIDSLKDEAGWENKYLFEEMII